MKKLTWLFLSMMLVLGMGTAFADGEGGETPTTPEVPAPAFNPDGGAVPAGTKVILTNGTENDATPKPIYYNIKGTGSAEFDAVKNQTQLTAAVNNIAKKLIPYPAAGIEITKNTPINAATADIDADGNVTWSTVITKNFTIGTVSAELVAPTFTPDGGEVKADEKITLATTTTGADIYYINSTTASFINITTKEDLESVANAMMATAIKYDNTNKPMLSDFQVETPGDKCSISAAAVLTAADGTLTWSDVTTKEFTVKASDEPEPDVAIPVISPANDAVVHMGDMVTITCATDNAEIYYTSDGTAPFTMDKDGYPVAVKEGALKYTGPFALEQTMLIRQNTVWALKIRAVAVKGDAISPNGGSAGYVVYPNAPTFSPVAGEVVAGTKVAIKCVPDSADIYYTIDGTTPTEGSTVYTDSIEITAAMTIKAIAVLGQYDASASASYTIKEAPVVEEKDTLPTPKFNPVGGEVEKGTAVVLSCDTANAKIYYSINADTVTENSLEYTTAIVIDSAMTIKAIAVKDGFVNSPEASAAYTVKKEDPVDPTANEGKELAGVSVYPNPNSGMFYIELPVAATVEVFASNGVLVKNFTASAGKATLNLDHSGIYFIRVASEGRATVKRVIVR